MSIIEKAMETGEGPVKRVHPITTQVNPNPEFDSLLDLAVGVDATVGRPGKGVVTDFVRTSFEKTTSIHREIDIEFLRNAGMITPDNENSRIAEEFRRIKRNLLINALGYGAQPYENGNVIMVASGLPQEGKSFCAINLAISMAMEMEKTVLLVDADFAKPSIPVFLGIDAERGLMDVLSDPGLSLSDVLITTNIEKLTILPAGKPHARATELLASEAMHRLVYEIANRYPDRIIIFDSPPVLMTSAASILASLMGQVVLVVQEEVTKHDVFKKTLALLESAPVVGVMLNKSSHSNSATYGDYYGYLHGKLASTRTGLLGSENGADRTNY